MVATDRPATWPSATRQPQTGRPSRRIVQAPQSPALHPTFVPCRPSSSRSTSESRRNGGANARTGLPFTSKLVPVRASSIDAGSRRKVDRATHEFARRL